jgi:hypothetical protein
MSTKPDTPPDIPVLTERMNGPEQVYVMNVTHVVVTNIDISLWRMVELMVKASIAVIPAAIIIAFIYMIGMAFLAGFSGVVKP